MPNHNSEILPCFIPFDSEIDSIDLPERFNYPFCYEPHQLALIAAKQLQNYIVNNLETVHHFGSDDTPGIGKMFGVLVVKNREGNLGFLAAFSGKMGNSNHYEGFVPPVFDVLDPEGFYKEGEAKTNVVNREIEKIQVLEAYKDAVQKLQSTQVEAENFMRALKEWNNTEKAKRKEIRAQSQHLPKAEYELLCADLEKRSIYQHYKLKESATQWKAIIEKAEEELNEFKFEIDKLKIKRKKMSADLQQQLFEKYAFLNKDGISKNLMDIFDIKDDLTPPSGAGECAAPKLLQYAFRHQLKPITMAEFWWGKSPASEVRKHGFFYPACNGKCKPILSHMLAGIEMDQNPMLINPAEGKDLPIVYEDDYLLIVNKPTEFLSVPGKEITDSVYSRLRELYPHASGPLIVHRLDMSTSGLMLIAKSKGVHQNLQSQFIKRKVKKRYVAVLKGSHDFTETKGEINLPLRVDLDDRPRQLVCEQYGKPAKTYWELINSNGDEHRVYFYPHTGRTHQLRVHASHPLGLNLPIKGDDLYGTRMERLYLHSDLLEFVHPIAKTVISIQVDPDF